MYFGRLKLGWKPQVVPQIVEDSFDVAEIRITPIPVYHGDIPLMVTVL